MREHIYRILQRPEKDDHLSRFYDLFIMFMAFLSIAPMMFRPEDLSANGQMAIRIIDIVTVYALLFDYILRWMTHDIKRQRCGKHGGRVSFLIYPFTPLAILDLLAILPTLLPMAEGFKFLRLLRLAKIFRVSSSLEAVGNVFLHEGRTLISVFGITILFVLVSALALYLNEPETFASFIDALYWATSSLTTIGYGDFYPTSDTGKMLNVASSVLGIAVVALPAGIITAGYVAETHRREDAIAQQNRAIDTSASLFRFIQKSLEQSWISLKRRSLRAFFFAHPKIAKYLLVMTIACLVDLSLMLFSQFTDIEFGFDLIGTAYAAALLEPAAGIIVGFIDCLNYSLLRQDPSTIIYLLMDVCVALCFWYICSRKEKPSRMQILVFAIFIFILTTTIESSVAYIIGDTAESNLLASPQSGGLKVPFIESAILLQLIELLLHFAVSVAFIFIITCVFLQLRSKTPFDNWLYERIKKIQKEEGAKSKFGYANLLTKKLDYIKRFFLPAPRRSPLRERIYDIVTLAARTDKASTAYDVFLILVAIISVSPILFQGETISPQAQAIVQTIDVVTACILLFDYFLRWMTYDIRRREEGKRDGWFSFLLYPFTPLAILDIVSLLPTIIMLGEAFGFLRLLRLTKIFRVSKSMVIIANVFIHEGRTLFSVLQITLIYIITTALILFTNEPETFSSFLDALYWASTALATIGYGDIHPVTDTGKLINICSALVGIMVVALPAGILTGGYVTEMQRLKSKGSRRQRSITLGSGLEEHLFDNVMEARHSLSFKKLISFFRNRPRVVLYFAVMTLCILGDFLIAGGNTSYGTESLYLFDFVGAAIAALLLEPAAGLIVGFINCVFYAAAYNSIADINYFLIAVAISLVLGMVIPARKPFKLRKYLLAALLLVIACEAVDALVSVITGQPWLFDSLMLLITSGSSDLTPINVLTAIYLKAGPALTIMLVVYPICHLLNKLLVNDPLNLRMRFIDLELRGNAMGEYENAAVHSTPAIQEQQEALDELANKPGGISSIRSEEQAANTTH